MFNDDDLIEHASNAKNRQGDTIKKVSKKKKKKKKKLPYKAPSLKEFIRLKIKFC